MLIEIFKWAGGRLATLMVTAAARTMPEHPLKAAQQRRQPAAFGAVTHIGYRVFRTATT